MSLLAQATTDIFGSVSPPPGVKAFDAMSSTAAGGTGIGLILFISNLIKIGSIIAGLIGLFNIISAGYQMISSSGNPKAMEEANNKLFMSLIGMALIVGSYTIIAIVSLLLFGKADFILNPVLPTAGV